MDRLLRKFLTDIDSTESFLIIPQKSLNIIFRLMNYIKFFTDIYSSDEPLVGGKNASLGEMIHTVKHPQALKFLSGLQLRLKDTGIILESNHLYRYEKDHEKLRSHGGIAPRYKTRQNVRELIYEAPLPADLS